MTDANPDRRRGDEAAPGDDETLLPDESPRTGPLTPSDDPVDDEESPVGGPP